MLVRIVDLVPALQVCPAHKPLIDSESARPRIEGILVMPGSNVCRKGGGHGEGEKERDG